MISTKLDLNVIEEDIEIKEIDFTVVDDKQVEFKDSRDYVDKCFKKFTIERGVENKVIRSKICTTNEEPDIAPGEIVALINYKSQPSKGRKNIFAGYDVLHISTPYGPLRLPLYEAEKFGKSIVNVARSAIKNNSSSQVNDNTEK